MFKRLWSAFLCLIDISYYKANYLIVCRRGKYYILEHDLEVDQWFELYPTNKDGEFEGWETKGMRGIGLS